MLAECRKSIVRIYRWKLRVAFPIVLFVGLIFAVCIAVLLAFIFENKNYENQISDLNNQVSVLYAKNQKLQSDNEQLTQDNQDLQDQIDDMAFEDDNYVGPTYVPQVAVPSKVQSLPSLNHPTLQDVCGKEPDYTKLSSSEYITKTNDYINCTNSYDKKYLF